MLFLSPDLLPHAVNFSLPAVLWVFVAAAVVGVIAMTAADEFRKVKRALARVYAIAVVLTIAGVCGTGITFLISLEVFMHDCNAAVTEHNLEIVRWLGDDYGIEVSTANVKHLLNGDDLVVQYQGAAELIELKPTAEGPIAVYSVDDRTLLKAR